MDPLVPAAGGRQTLRRLLFGPNSDIAPVCDHIGRPFAILLVHHENRAGQVSGAWEGVPDTLIHVQGQGHGRTRVFWQKARWSEIHQTVTQLVWAPGATFAVEDKPEITDDTIANDIIAAARDNPGGSWSKIRDHVTGNATECARVRDRLLELGQIVNTATRDGYFNLTLPEDPNLTGSETGTALERLTFPTTDGADEPSRSPVPAPSRNGDRNGTTEPWSHLPEHERVYLQSLEPEMAEEGIV